MVKTIKTPTHNERQRSSQRLHTRWNTWRQLDPASKALATADNSSNPRPGGGNLATARLLQQQKENQQLAGSPTTTTNMGPASNKTVTVNKTAYNKLLEDNKNLRKKEKDLIKDARETKKELDNLKSELEAADDDNAAKANDIAALQDHIAKQDEWITKAKASMANQKTTITELEKALGKTGSAITTNRKDDMVKHILFLSKVVLFRNWKFIQDEADLVEATTELIPYLSIELGMTEEAFIPLYKDVVNSGLSEQRQYIQSQGKKVCTGTLDLCVCVLFCVTKLNICCLAAIIFCYSLHRILQST
jgi:hypothetical protein